MWGPILMLLGVDSSDEQHNQRDTEEVIGVSEEAHASYDDGLEMVKLSSCNVKGGKNF